MPHLTPWLRIEGAGKNTQLPPPSSERFDYMLSQMLLEGCASSQPESGTSLGFSGNLKECFPHLIPQAHSEEENNSPAFP